VQQIKNSVNFDFIKENRSICGETSFPVDARSYKCGTNVDCVRKNINLFITLIGKQISVTGKPYYIIFGNKVIRLWNFTGSFFYEGWFYNAYPDCFAETILWLHSG